MADNLADTELDAPAARERYEAAVAAATAGGWIEEAPVPTPCTPSESWPHRLIPLAPVSCLE